MTRRHYEVGAKYVARETLPLSGFVALLQSRQAIEEGEALVVEDVDVRAAKVSLRLADNAMVVMTWEFADHFLAEAPSEPATCPQCNGERWVVGLFVGLRVPCPGCVEEKHREAGGG